jgi:signal transduction histidine kinase
LGLAQPAQSPLFAGDRKAGIAAGVLVLFIALFVIGARYRSAPSVSIPTIVTLAVAQGVCALTANLLLDDGLIIVLLILVAAQLGAAVRPLTTVGWLLALNIGFIVPLLHTSTLSKVALQLLPILGFQAFGAISIRYAVTAERARDELAQVNSELMMTRALLNESARSEERLRLSRELHDVAGHSLTALKLNLNAALRDPALSDRADLKQSAMLANELLTQIRQVVGALREHDGVNLRAAIEALGSPFQNTEVRLAIEDRFRVGDMTHAEALLRVAQEAITNAVRHGRARVVDIVIERCEGVLLLRISNDGGASDEVRFGNGLTGMRERLQALGGTLDVSCSKENGFRVTARLPEIRA